MNPVRVGRYWIGDNFNYSPVDLVLDDRIILRKEFGILFQSLEKTEQSAATQIQIVWQRWMTLSPW